MNEQERQPNSYAYVRGATEQLGMGNRGTELLGKVKRGPRTARHRK
jgi:hypothetical protein